MTSLHVDKQLLQIRAKCAKKNSADMPSFRSLVKLWRKLRFPCQYLFVCFYEVALLISAIFLPSHPPNINTTDYSLVLHMETLLPVWFTDKANDSFWRGDALAVFLGDKEGWKRADWGLLSLLLSGSSVLQRGFRGAVICWDVRDWLPLGWKCNMTMEEEGGSTACVSIQQSRKLPGAFMWPWTCYNLA